MDIPSNPKELFEYFLMERSKSTDLRDEMNKDLSEKRAVGIRDRRQFIQNITIASVTLLGFVAAFAAIGGNVNVYHPYFVTGIAMHLLLVCFSVVHIREVIDQDNEGLLKMQDRYTEIVQNQINLIENYVGKIGENGDIRGLLARYFEELHQLESSKDLEAENIKLDSERKKRRNGPVLMEFNGEIIVYLFVVGTSFIFVSLEGLYIANQYMCLALFLLFFVIFTDFLSKALKPVFWILTYLTKVDILKRFKGW